jgi:hypothetical protein
MCTSPVGWSEPVPGRELHPLKSSAFHGALFRPLLQKRNSASDPVNCLVFRWADGKGGKCARC